MGSFFVGINYFPAETSAQLGSHKPKLNFRPKVFFHARHCNKRLIAGRVIFIRDNGMVNCLDGCNKEPGDLTYRT